MKTNSQKSIKVSTAIKAGGFGPYNHNRKALSVKTGIKAGEGIAYGNHSRRLA
jgi:hypothetical protein